MGYKYKIAKLEDVAENIRALYKPEGDAFILDVDGVVPKERVDEFRTNNIQLQQRLDALKDVDPVKYAELIKLDNEIKEGELIKKGDVEGVVNLRVTAMKADLENKLNQSNTSLQKANAQLGVVLIDNSVKTAALKTGVAPTAVDDVVLRARAIYQIHEGNPVPKNEKGEIIYGKDGTTPMPMEDWVKGLKEVAPHLFLGASGSGAGGGNQSGVKNTASMSAVDKINAGLAAGGLLGTLPQG
jgi:hypothetical protein